MQVREIMTKDVSCCTPGTNAAAAGEKMWNKGCGSLPVVTHPARGLQCGDLYPSRFKPGSSS
jgi:hypothetical protein